MIRAALSLAVLAAWALFRAVPTSRQRGLATGLTLLLAVDCARLAHLPTWLDRAAFIGWYAVYALTVWRALGMSWRSSPAMAFVTVAAVPVSSALAFWIALVAQFVAVAICVRRRVIPGQVETTGLLLAASSLADVAGPWLCGRPHDDWWIGRYTSVVTWLAVVGWEWRCWIRARGSVG